MIIERLDLIAFGRFYNESLDLAAGPRRFHLVYGPNESGKSTCLRAISSLLFGIPNKTSDSYLHGNQKLRVGATLADESVGKLSVIRRKGIKSTLLDSDGQTVADPARLSAMLGGIDEATFRHRFGLSHEQLVEGGKDVLASQGELGEILFAAGAGVGRLKAIQKELESEGDALFLGRGKKKINLLLKELEEKRKELRDRQSMPAEYRSLVTELGEAENRSKQLSVELANTNRELSKRRAYQDARPIVPVWIREKARLKELDSVPTLDQDFSARRREAAANRETYEKIVGNLKHELDAIEQQIESSPIDTATIQHEREIVSLFQGIAARQTAMKDQIGLRRIVKNHNRHIRELLRDLDVNVPEETSQTEVDELVERLHVSDSAQIRIAELAGDFELRRQQERDSLEKLQTLRKHLADLEDELERTPVVNDPRSIESVLADVGTPVSLMDPVEQQQTICRDLESECESLLRKLNLLDTSVAAAVKMQPPTIEQIDEQEEILSKRTRAREDVEKLLQQLLFRRRQGREELARLQAEQTLPTEEELSEARKQRDRLIDQVDSVADDLAKVRESTGEVRRSVRNADEVVDVIRSHQIQVSQRAAVQKELAEVDSQIEVAETDVQNAILLMEQATSDWEQLWSRCNVSVGSVRQMRSWGATLQILVDKFSSLQKARQRLKSADDRVQRGASRLASAVRLAWSARPVTAGPSGATTVDTAELNLEALHDAALSLRSELAAAASNVEQLERKRSEIQLEIPRAEASHEACVNRRKQWDEEWKDAIDSFSEDKDSSPSVISNRLKKIANIFQEKRERDILLGRIRSIDLDNDSFAARVIAVAKLVGLKSEDARQSADVAQMLHDQFMDAKTKASQRERLQQELTDRKKNLDSATLTLETAVGQLAELCREAGVKSADELPAVEERSLEKRSTTQAVANAEQQLMLISGGDPVDQFADQVQSQDPIELESLIVELEQRCNDLNGQWSTAQQKVGAVKKELSEIDGGDKAAELNQSLQLLTGRIQRESQRYAKSRIASMILQRAIEHYRRENESPVLKLACEAFEDLTCGRYSGLRTEYDDKGRSKLFGIEKTNSEEESLVAVEALSLGTADALYLAMRLASLEHQLSAGHAIPVVIDDCLIQLDDERAVATMKRFSKLSERTQVILFTHHQHLVELAESSLSEGDFHLHRLQ